MPKKPQQPNNYKSKFEKTIGDYLGTRAEYEPDRISFIQPAKSRYYIPDFKIDAILKFCQNNPQHIFQILTKRAERINDWECYPENVWLGVTVENREHKNRINYLQTTNANIKFLSCEPLLGDLGTLDLSGIDWVIVGGESGHHARPMQEDWVTNVQEQADAAGSAFFFKQWGGWGADGVKRHKKANGRVFKGRTWDAYPSAQQVAY